MIDHALAYARRGISVFATTADGKAPSTSNAQWGKRIGMDGPLPKGQGGFRRATTDEDELRWMFSFKNAQGIGMPCGRINGVIVADFDIHKKGEEGRNANRQFEEYRDAIGEAQIVTTRNGGVHAYFKYERGHGQRELGDGVEVQNDGQYVLLPPSKGYKWGPLVAREDWVKPPWRGFRPAEQREAVQHGGETPQHVLKLIDILHKKEGGWHNAARDLTAHLIGSGWTDAAILRYAIQWTKGGYKWADTFEELACMVDGA
ncbi:MAG: bifunctional DNA primase/polymerase, partial [Propionibacteriaceae bacterium]|nr:bifunctional DNA primase/polymerase [Propionibacteriaceae bacterium]